jgi:putative hydrolase of the HAD superfamily
MAKLKAIFFDIDDTLYSTSEFARLARLNSIKAMIDVGLKMSERELMDELDEVVTEFSSNYQHHYDKLLLRIPAARYKGVNRAVIVAAAVAAYHDTKFRQLKLFDDVRDALEKLSRTRLMLGTITEGVDLKQAEKLLRLNLLEYFHPEAIFISDQIGISKPNEKLYEWALKTMQISPAQAMYVGDNPINDIDPPNRVGMVTVRVKRGGKYAALIGKTEADYEIKTFRELLEILQKDFGVRAT